METRLDRTGVDATANNIIRTARATARFFRKPRQGDLILSSQISSIRNEGRHEGNTAKADDAHGYSTERVPLATLRRGVTRHAVR